MDSQSVKTLLRQLESWYYNVDFNEFVKAIEDRVIGQEEVRLVLANVYNYIGNIVEDRPVNNNMILAAPSGSGKTETYRAIKDYFCNEVPALPVYIVDVSHLTAAGFRGMDPDDILGPFYALRMIDAIGICFMDEFDKKLVSLRNSSESDLNREAQSELLTIVEGSDVSNKRGEIVNTSNVMFIALGSFDAYRDKREVVEKHIGFGAENGGEAIDHYASIVAEDMVKHGGTNELIGRFPIIANYQKLDDAAIRKIINKVTEEIHETFDCQLIIADEMFEELFEAANSKFGCRAFHSMIMNVAMRVYAKALCDRTNEVLVITIHNKNDGDYMWRKRTEEEQKYVLAFKDAMDEYRYEKDSDDEAAESFDDYSSEESYSIEDLIREGLT